MGLKEMTFLALDVVLNNRLRSGLAILGIVIGITSVLMITCLGHGLHNKMMNQFDEMGANLFDIYIVCVEDGHYEQYRFDLEDYKYINETVNNLKYLSPVSSLSTSAQSWKTRKSCTVIGTDGNYRSLRNLEMTSGIFFSTIDTTTGRNVVVINQELSDQLFGVSSNPVGSKVVLGQTSFIICGVCKQQLSIFSAGKQPPLAYLPITVFQSTFNMTEIQYLEGSALSSEIIDDVSQEVIDILRVRHLVARDDVYEKVTMEQQKEITQSLAHSLTIVLGGIAGISLVVGGIGVMNIMLMSVSERIREIGIRMAVGARKQHIILQFLIESIVLSLLGGAIGIVLGFSGGSLVCFLFDLPFRVDMASSVGAIAIAIALGVFSGIYPANLAANLNPVEALRYD